MKFINLLIAGLLFCSVVKGQENASKAESDKMNPADKTGPDTNAVLDEPREEKETQNSSEQSSRRIRILEDKFHSIDMYKIKDMEGRIRALEQPKTKDSTNTDKFLTPLATGEISKWGTGPGMGLCFGSVSHNTSIGLEIALMKFLLPQFERPLSHTRMLGFSVGMDWWFNTGLRDNEEWGISPYLKITANSMVFENYLRMYGSVEPVIVYGTAIQGQNRRDLHLGLRGAFGAEFYASRNYNFYAEVGIMKTESIDGSTDDTGITPSIKAGPRFWF